MANIFIISDTHFSHANILTFATGESGGLLRPGFRDFSEMDEAMVDRWNRTVRPQDHVYHLGDVAMKRQAVSIVRRLNGHKRLVFGNHDIFDYSVYAAAGFEKMMGMRVLDGILFTHVPVHPESLGRFRANVHGHLHANRVLRHDGSPDARYLNVCVEQIDYTPVSFDLIRASSEKISHECRH